jgi:hypothetical protein
VDELKEELVKVVVDLPEPDMGVSGEGIWAAPIGDDVYEIRNSPWHARNINWGDWVKAVAPNEDQWPRFVSIVKRSGHRTIHVYFLQDDQERKKEILEGINKLGTFYEEAFGKLYAFDCAPEVALDPILNYLTPLKESEVLDLRISEY